MTKEILKTMSLERLVELFESTTEGEIDVPTATVRGWLMDEIESRNPEGFDKWLDLEEPEDSELRKYVL